MKITNSDHRAPIEILPDEAARILMAKRHITLYGPLGGRQERLLRIIGTLLSGQCRYIALQARYEPKGPPALIAPSTDPHAPAYLVMFVPDSSETRFAIVACFIAELGVESADEAFRDAARGVEGAILMLGGETEAETEALAASYALIVNGLEAVAEGRAINVSHN